MLHRGLATIGGERVSDPRPDHIPRISDPSGRARETASSIRRTWPHEASIGLILGTGAAAVAERFRPECELAFGDLPHLVPATAVGHPGRFLGGRIGRNRVAVLQGRVHLYEGYTPRQVQYPVRVLAALGARTLVVTNASGGLNPAFHCGDLVVLDDLVDLTFSVGPNAVWEPGSRGRAPVAKAARGSGSPSRPSPAPIPGGMGPVTARFSRELVASAWAAGRRAGIGIQRGTYVGVMGPNYETRAEYRFLRRIGDAVGMSTVHEVAAARRLGMRVLGLSVVSNECCPDRLARTTGESVVRAVEEAADRLGRLIEQTCSEL